MPVSRLIPENYEFGMEKVPWLKTVGNFLIYSKIDQNRIEIIV